jgi:hypothetical protein
MQLLSTVVAAAAARAPCSYGRARAQPSTRPLFLMKATAEWVITRPDKTTDPLLSLTFAVAPSRELFDATTFQDFRGQECLGAVVLRKGKGPKQKSPDAAVNCQDLQEKSIASKVLEFSTSTT